MMPLIGVPAHIDEATADAIGKRSPRYQKALAGLGVRHRNACFPPTAALGTIGQLLNRRHEQRGAGHRYHSAKHVVGVADVVVPGHEKPALPTEHVGTVLSAREVSPSEAAVHDRERTRNGDAHRR